MLKGVCTVCGKEHDLVQDADMDRMVVDIHYNELDQCEGSLYIPVEDAYLSSKHEKYREALIRLVHAIETDFSGLNDLSLEGVKAYLHACKVTNHEPRLKE